MAVTSGDEVTNVTQTYIRDRAFVPVAYNVPMNEMAKVFRLPRAGITLRVPKIREMALSGVDTDLWSGIETDFLQIGDTDGQVQLNLDYDDYTLTKRGAFVTVTDKAHYSSLVDIADAVSTALSSLIARQMNSDAYTAAITDGFQWMRTDGDNTAAQFEQWDLTASSAGTTTTTIDTALTSAVTDFYKLGQITFVDGPNAGKSAVVSAFTTATDTLTHTAMPQAPGSGTTFHLCGVGNAEGSGPDDLAAANSMTLTQVYRALERCRRYGAGALRGAGPSLSVSGIMRDNSADVANGVGFIPTPIAHDLKLTVMKDGTATDAYFQTSEGFRRAVGGQLSRLGGVLFVEVNHQLRKSVTAGTLAATTGAAWPTVFLFKDAFGATVLKDNPGNRQGLSSVVKVPKKNDIAVLYDSIKLQAEMYVLNKYFAHNALHGAVMWAGTASA